MNSFDVLKKAEVWIKNILFDVSQGKLYVQKENNFFYILQRLTEVTIGVSCILLQNQKREKEIICQIFDKNVFFSDSRFDSHGGSFANISREDLFLACGESGIFDEKLEFLQANEKNKPRFLEEKGKYSREIAFPSLEGIKFCEYLDSLKKKLAEFAKEEEIDKGIQFIIPVKVVMAEESHSLSKV